MTATVSTVADLFRGVHQQLRAVVDQVDEADLDWTPGAEMNSVAVLVTHTLGSELDTLNLVRGITAPRDRDAEFAVSGTKKVDLLAALDQGDARLAEHAAAITEDDLAATRERPGRDPQTGLHWLLNNYGHAREHLAHAQMTAQLLQQRG
jgi:hypothetical protein